MNNIKWTNDEEKFLKDNYEQKGGQWISQQLNRSINTVRIKANRYGLSFDNIPEKYRFQNFKVVVNCSKNLTEILRNLGMTLTGDNTKTLKKYISKYELSTNHFETERVICLIKYDLSTILISGSSYTHTFSLKKRLYKEGIKQRQCELCSQGETWNRKKMSLILDHINGVHNDNRLENLRIVCPNCNATLDTHCGKNKSAEAKRIKKERQKTKSKLFHFNRRKIKNRPSKDILFKEVEETSYCAVGRKYGVSDNCIRKWLK